MWLWAKFDARHAATAVHTGSRSRVCRAKESTSNKGRCEGRVWRGLLVDRRGVAALEFAMLSAPMLMLLFGFISINLILYSWSSMQTAAQNAATVLSTGQISTFTSSAASPVNCSPAPASTTVEYYGCQGLPNWTTFKVAVTQTCSAVAGVPSTVLVSVSAANMSSAGLVDTYNIFSGKPLVATANMIKQGSCP